VAAMADVTVYHNPNCGSSKNALALLDELGVDYEVVLYLKTPPDRVTLERIVAGLDGPVEDLVRKDNRFEKLGLDPDTYVGRPEAVVELLTIEKALMQRPLLVRGDRAIIGRPKERIPGFVA
jgi:arsenate reductase